MIKFIIFALYLCISAALLIIWPVMLHPTLPLKKKIIVSAVTFCVLVPLGVALYVWLGVPHMAVD